VSNEGSSLLERHIEKMNIQYPIASVKGEDADRIYGVKGFPSGALLDPDGVVIWTGHPASVPRALIEEQLGRTAFLPRLEAKEHKKVDKLIGDREYGKAHAAIVKQLEKGADEVLEKAQADIEALLARRLEEAKAAQEGGDLARAHRLYEEVSELFKGHDAEKPAKEAAKAIEKDPAAKDELDAADRMAKGDEAQREGDFEKAAKLYEGVVSKYPETKAAERAKAFLQRHPL
jgi:tetratricopeptide (TPR) repeat protein